MRILICAGEASGEMYGAQLIHALRQRIPSLEFFGVGGERMRDAGCDTIVDAKDLAVVGITEILSHLPRIYGHFQKLIAETDRRRPDLAIVIDSPAFNWRVARQMKKRGIPVVYYVAPQFWAWRQGRVKLLKKYVTKALVIFPFEEKFYRDRGVDATFVGHPLAGLPTPAVTREEYAKQNGIHVKKPWITVMPGSRIKEVRMNLGTIVDSMLILGCDYEYLLPVAPTLSPEFLYRAIVEDEWGDARVERPDVHLVSEASPALFHSRAGIVASGTATVEAAMMGTPFVMVYRVSPLTYALGKPRIKVPHFAMVNLIAGEKVVPELVQQDFTAANVTARLKEILPDSGPRSRMVAGLAEVRARLQPNAGLNPPSAADRAANEIARMLSKNQPNLARVAADGNPAARIGFQ